ncbi:SDR family oxidoreductase [Rubellicoccus peritrichatus]|uniref:SDR family oxidoreductase n=1 Tax=Rubellicoccus peritrichatus TaxID=3080537 RepID=A0AAQ3L6D3_9BACT|nr:SDR family oxidoreductase [Puniceicoccus sp. CR14]WOO39801.1 SDR family oxidoreductase [Puniceicoccus sp. CR14]
MNKTILITGTSSGIGKAAAKFFHEQGWNVIATMRTPEKETELTQLDRTLVTRLDVTDPDSIHNSVLEGIAKFGRIDVLVNNAGYGAFGPLEAFPMEKIRRQFDTNVIGLLEVTKAVIPHMRQNKAGTILNVSSVGGRMAFPLGALYHGTKFAVEGISEALQFEFAACGIKVKVIEPGGIKTDFSGRSFDFTNDDSIEEYQQTVSAVQNAFSSLTDVNAAPAVEVAEVMLKAINDDSNELRYPAAGGAETFLEHRTSNDDPAYFAGTKAMFGLT